VLDGDLEDLREQEEVHVDRAVRQGPHATRVASSETIHDLDRRCLPLLRGGSEPTGMGDLLLAVAIDLRDGDLGEPVLGEERQQMLGQVVAVAASGIRCELEALEREPIRGELEKPRVLLRLRWMAA
jgi:hypothetical protein